MILLSLIVGLGLAEILSGIARLLKANGVRGITLMHGAITATVFIALLQTFWEAWSLRSQEVWSFPAMLLMLGSPVFLFLSAHVLFPERQSTGNLDEHYLARAPLIWGLAGMTVVVGTIFRPIAFDMPLWVVDNVSAIPTLAVCILLSTIKTPWLHRTLVPIVLLIVLWDTLAINYSIG